MRDLDGNCPAPVNQGQEQGRRATRPEGEAAAHRSFELHVGRKAWVERGGEASLRTVLCSSAACCLSGVLGLWGGRRRPPSRGHDGLVMWPTRTIVLEAFRGLVLSCRVLTCLIPGVTGQQDLAPAWSSLMTAVATTVVG